MKISTKHSSEEKSRTAKPVAYKSERSLKEKDARIYAKLAANLESEYLVESVILFLNEICLEPEVVEVADFYFLSQDAG